MRDAFEKSRFLLMPEDRVLDSYLKSLKISCAQFYSQRAEFPEFPVRFIMA